MSEKIKATQRDATRNQSTVDFQRKNIFLYGNRNTPVVFKNNTGADLDIEAGLLLIRNSADATQVIPAIAGATLVNVIGFLNIEGKNTLADGETINANLCLNGDIDSSLITLPATVTLDTVTSGKALKDTLTALGFVLHNVIEGSKFAN